MLRLTIPGDPAPWQVYTRQGPPPLGVLKCQAWQEQIRAYLRQAWGDREPLTGPVVLERWFYLPWPDSAPQRDPKAIYKWYWKHLAMKPDLDNLAKAFSDAGEGILFFGDQQIVEGETRKDILRPTLYNNPKQGFTEIRFRAKLKQWPDAIKEALEQQR